MANKKTLKVYFKVYQKRSQIKFKFSVYLCTVDNTYRPKYNFNKFIVLGNILK